MDAIQEFDGTHSRIQLSRVRRRADKRCHDFSRLLNAIHKIDIGHGVSRLLQGRQDTLPDGRNTFAFGSDVDLVGRFCIDLVEGNAINGVNERDKKRIAGEDEEGDQPGFRDPVGTGAGAYGGRSPESGGRIQAANIATFLHDHTGSQKTDAGHHIGDHSNRPVGTGHDQGEIDEGSRPDRDQHIGAQPRTSLAILAFGANSRPKYKGGDQANETIQKG
jgi:hypothetical protein